MSDLHFLNGCCVAEVATQAAAYTWGDTFADPGASSVQIDVICDRSWHDRNLDQNKKERAGKSGDMGVM